MPRDSFVSDCHFNATMYSLSYFRLNRTTWKSILVELESSGIIKNRLSFKLFQLINLNSKLEQRKMKTGKKKFPIPSLRFQMAPFDSKNLEFSEVAQN